MAGRIGAKPRALTPEKRVPLYAHGDRVNSIGHAIVRQNANGVVVVCGYALSREFITGAQFDAIRSVSIGFNYDNA